MEDYEKSKIEEELKIWEERVYYPNERFRVDTKADLDELLRIFKLARENFIIISSYSESSVYKIGRKFIEFGLKNEKISFIDGELISPFVDNKTPYPQQATNLINEFIENNKIQIKNRWIFIPDLRIQWTKNLSIYFISKLKENGALGLLFYSGKGGESLGQILCQDTYTKVYQYPARLHKTKREQHTLDSDEF